jgi:hypothetical protein
VDEFQRVSEPQLDADVATCAGIGSGRDRQARHLREYLRQPAEHAVFGSEVVAPFEDIYLIDWDEVLLAPAERDTWIMDHFSRFIDGYRYSRPGYVVNANMRSFYIYKHHFRSMMHYFSEILGAFESEYRLGHVRDLEEALLIGWMLPKLKKISASSQ